MGSEKELGVDASVWSVSGSVVVALILLMGGCNSSGSMTATPGLGSATHSENAQTFPMASSSPSSPALEDGSWTSFFFDGEDFLNENDALIAFVISQGITDPDDIVTLANLLRDPGTDPITLDDVTGQNPDPVQVADFNGNEIPGEIEDAAVLFVVQQPEFADLMPEELENVIFEQLSIETEIDPDAMIPRLPSPTPTASPTSTPSGPVVTTLIADVSSGSTMLPVQSTDGFTVGGTIVINLDGPTQETNILTAIGSSLTLAQPVSFDHSSGEVVAQLSSPSPTPIPTFTPTPTPDPSLTPTPTPSLTPTSTPTPTPTPTSNPSFSVFEINRTDDTGEAIVNGLIQIDNPQQGVITQSQISNFVIFLEDNAGSSLLDPSNSTLTADNSLSLNGNNLFLLIETFLQIADSTFANILFGGDFLGDDGVADVSLTINGSTFEATGQQGDPFATFCRNDTSLEDGLNLDPIFTDGFESGDTTAWCDQAP